MSGEAKLLALEIASMPVGDDSPVVTDARASVSGVSGSLRVLGEKKISNKKVRRE